MSHGERTGKRSLVYSGWHRPSSIKRYINITAAAKLSMIDVDACEYCCFCSTPVALIETQESLAPPKSARVLTVLARMAGIPAYSVSVAVEDEDVVGFRLQQLGVLGAPVTDLAPAEYARWLVRLRDGHRCTQDVAA